MDTINRTDLKNKNTFRVLIAALGFFLSLKCQALNITILDTGFCPNQIEKTHNITILEVKDLTKSVKLDCTKPIDKRDKRFHGQKVLQTLISNLSTMVSINIRPFIIFDEDKMQIPTYWKRAFSSDIQAQTDIYLIAAGYPYLTDKSGLEDINPSKLVFVSSGTNSISISKEHKLWPQELGKKSENIILMGEYYPKTKFDSAYLDKRIKYKEITDFFFPYRDEQDEDFHGSSYSVAFGLAKILSKCDTTKLKEQLTSKECGKTILLDKNLSF